MRYFAVLLLLISGCTHHNIQIYKTIDHTNKTITVPPGSKGLKGKLKQVLSENGWEMVVDRGPDVTEGEFDKKVNLKNYNTFNSSYRLYVRSYQYDLCFNFSPAITYEISFIDNNLGAEVFTIEGNGCECDVIKKFEEAISR